MSYRSREKKRKVKLAVARARREYRDLMSTRYYLTIVKRPARCSACGKHLRRGDEMVYCAAGPVTLCIPDADADPLVSYRTSAKWEQWRGRERRKAA